MSRFDALLAEFARRLGLEHLRPEADGCVDLLMEKIGRFQLEEDGDWLLATLARPVDPHATGRAGRLLALTHWRENHPYAIHPGMRGEEWLTLTTRVPLTAADLPTLERVIEMLARLHDEAEATAE